MNILFISRAHPPVIGGIENQNEAVGRWLSKVARCHSIINTRGKRFLPFFIPWAIIKGIVVARQADVILLGDGVAAIIGWSIKIFYPSKPVVTILHGLDVTYRNRLYQGLWIGVFFSRIDRFIAVSRSTADIAIAKGVPGNRIEIIPNGIDTPEQNVVADRKLLSDLVGVDVGKKKILLTLGRLVKRKGVRWFLLNVLPRLPEDVFYIIAGEGPERQDIDTILASSEYATKAVCIGSVSEREKLVLFSSSDLFIQSNIAVSDDVEGFGVVILEAGIYGLPVIASNLEGLKDSVMDGENGWHVAPLDAKAFSTKITTIFENADMLGDLKAKSRNFVVDNYSWDAIVLRYIAALRDA